MIATLRERQRQTLVEKLAMKDINYNILAAIALGYTAKQLKLRISDLARLYYIFNEV
ncbi:hypothetical protein ACEYW6_21970 [Nostoc sp. UIC 10607]|uniref:hypothetical protein n=1 Tax=Nostoc sp. UIC 10607 TaxID=3045935 RepID=UPI0039A27EC9